MIPANPLLEMTVNPKDPVPLVELKQHLILFVDGPPGPRTARRIYDIGMAHFGNIFKNYRSTAPGKPLELWTREAQARFETVLLPALRSRETWGYAVSDGKPKDSWMMMIHGFRPAQEPDMASIYRFEFDWLVAPFRVRKLAEHLMNEFDFLSGYGGYFLQGRPKSKYSALSSDRLFALAHRYWGVEIEDIEATAEQMKVGYKCVNWLTLLGEPFRSRFGAASEQATLVAFEH